ncbi:MAG: hypothetical protein C4540_06360 [Candidatus Omnitrophota bacterium]|nr:MAG: hypothetical protein C4540_06360 [Candidatus Omnitrophota bacterium]
MKPSLKSGHRRLLILFFSFVFLAAVFQGILSYSFQKSRPQLVVFLSSFLGCRLEIESISFNYVRGAVVKGVAVFCAQEEQPSVYIKSASIPLSLTSFFRGKIAVGTIRIHEALFLAKKEPQGLNLQILYSDIYKRLSRLKNNPPGLRLINTAVYLENAQIFFTDKPVFEHDMYLSLRKARIRLDSSGHVRFKGKLHFKYLMSDRLFVTRFFEQKLIQEELDCSIQGKVKGNDFVMDMIVLDIGKEQIIGMGVNRNFAEYNPRLDITFIPSTVQVSNIGFLRNNFHPSGSIFVSLKINGPMDNTEFSLAGYAIDCSFKYHISSGEIFDIKSLNGELEFARGTLKIRNASFWFNDLPLNLVFEFYSLQGPRVFCMLSFPQQFISFHDPFLTKLEAVFEGKIKNTMEGTLTVSGIYKRKNDPLDLKAEFGNVDFDYFNPREKSLKADSVSLIKHSIAGDHKLNFGEFASVIRIGKNRFSINDIAFKGYHGRFSGKMTVDIKDKALFNGFIKGKGIEVSELTPDLNVTSKLLSGSMETLLKFDNTEKEFLKARCYVRNGVADLDVLASIVKLPSLTSMGFSAMHLYFSLSQELVRVRGFSLRSKDLMMDAHWNTNGRVEGVMDIQMSSELLNQSVSFKKLLNLTRIKKPYIDFKFMLGGLPKAVRVLWLKGEFKEKIKQGLPDWAEKSIQKNLDQAIDELSVSQQGL